MTALSFLLSAAGYWLFCVAWFSIVQKPMFGLYDHCCATKPITLRDIAAIYRHGNVSDCIIASYLTAIPLLIGAIGSMTAMTGTTTAMTIYNAIISLAAGLLVTADTALYRFWKYKIDASVFVYLKSLKGATASVSTTYLATGICAWLLTSVTFFLGAQATVAVTTGLLAFPDAALPWWGYPAVVISFCVAVGVLFMVIRGLGIRPNNPSICYFSSDPFLNHWALNPAYNMIYSLSVKDEFEGKFRTMTDEEAASVTSHLFPTKGTPQYRILNNSRPDILLVIWESLSAEYSGFFGGSSPSTPNLDALAKEGVAFTDCTASGFRTDRGLVAVLSGYPAQPTTSVIRYTRKLPNLPGLARSLRDAGYETTAIHGGDLAIMHKNDYYLASGHSRLIAQKDMPSGLDTCKWGIHDAPVMDLTAKEIIRHRAESDAPCFITLQTLSSHEPFEVPLRQKEDDVCNSFSYTDHALGNLVDQLKASGVWDNLLLIVVADHGLNLPRPVDNRRTHAHIPLVMAGGAVNGPKRIDLPISQTDIAATLLGQMDLPHHDFLFSRDVTADTYTSPSGIHAFHNGMMLADSDGYTVVDTMLDKVTEGDDTPRRRNQIAATLQQLYADLSRR